MKIETIDIHRIARPLRYPWRTAYGEDAAIHGVVIRLGSGGAEGWGEAAPLLAPTYSAETADTVYHVLCDFIAPQLLGRDFDTAEDLLDAIAFIKGNYFAKGAAESAWWTLKAETERSPLHRLLGGETREVAAGADFGVQDSIDMLLSKVAGAVDRGFSRIKLKIRRGWDAEVVRAVRTQFPNQTFHVDCNSGYTLDDLPLFRELDRYDLAMIEQPLAHWDILDHSKLQSAIATPVCLDETITSVRILEQALSIDACRYVNLKVGRVGGVSVAKRMHDIAADAGVPCWVGSMLESGIGMGILIELATLPNFTYAGDLFPTQEHCDIDLTEPEIVLSEDCTFMPSSVPALPYKPNPERLREFALASRSFVTGKHDA